MAPPTWKRYRPDPTPDGEPEVDGSTKPRIKAYRPPKEPKPVRSLEERTIRATGPARVVRLVVFGIVGLVVVGVGWLVWSIIDTARQPGPQTTEGFADLVEDLEEEHGSSEAFRAVVYPGYAVVEVPFADDERSVSYHWDTRLDESSKGTSTEQPFDLATIDPAGFDDMCDAVKKTVEDPEDCYLILEKPDEPDGAWISAYTSNEFGQSSYIAFDLAGNEVSRYPAG